MYHAKDVVYHYNGLPPYSLKDFSMGKRVAIVGAGNVMLDLAHWLIEMVKVDEVISVIRRGPAEVKFDKKELENVISYLDIICARELSWKRVDSLHERSWRGSGRGPRILSCCNRTKQYRMTLPPVSR